MLIVVERRETFHYYYPMGVHPPGDLTVTMMLSEKPNAQGILIVRRNRDVAQGTGALLSPNDWALGGQYTASAVLTMYKVTGRKGWGGQELWVPNIKLPSDLIYYDVQEDESST